MASAFRVQVTEAPVEAPRTPSSYADQRAGVLTCRWSSPDMEDGRRGIDAVVTVVPDATRQDVQDMLAGGTIFGGAATPSIAPDTYASCDSTYFQTCVFAADAEHYAVTGAVWDFFGGTHESQSKAMTALATAAVPVVQSLAAPVPLWQPEGASLRGASDCGGLLAVDRIAGIAGLTGVHVSRSDGGEYASSSLHTNARVGSYYCTWTADQDAQVVASVLPGGASFARSTRPADAVDVAGLGESAYRTTGTYGTSRTSRTVDVIAAGAWIQVQLAGEGMTDDMLVALARQEIATLGYTG